MTKPTNPSNSNGDVELREAINKYGKYPFDLYGILESLKGNDKSAYTALKAFNGIEQLIQTECTQAASEARKQERKLIEQEVWEAKYKEWGEHVAALKNTPVEVLRNTGKYFVKEMITDIQRGQPELLRVIIAPSNPELLHKEPNTHE
jgi:hypothetical protein